MHMLSPRERDLLPWGTTGNEALHRQLGYTMGAATLQHEDRVVSKALAFSLDGTLAHNSAAYSPTVTQMTQQTLLAGMQGHIAQAFCPESHCELLPISTKRDARTPGLRRDESKTAQQKQGRKARHEKWQKQDAIDASKRGHGVKKLAMKRTVFKKRKTVKIQHKLAAMKK